MPLESPVNAAPARREQPSSRTVFFVPPLKQLSGGLANIYEVARNLRALGGEVALMGPSEETVGLAGFREETSGSGIAALPWGTPLLPTDLWCIPESWPNAMAVGFNAKARVLVYVQNWVYMLNTLPQGVRWSALPLEYAAVSAPVGWFMREALRLEPGDILPPVVDAMFFSEGTRPARPVRVAWMPRKNRPLGEQTLQVARACLAELPAAPPVEWVSIHNVPRKEVASLLASCHIFLSTGFPEGFGLPPLEAMASGCVPVGCTGFGGWEYMRQARIEDLFSTFSPPFGCPEALQEGAPCKTADGQAPLPGNGFFFADGDSLGTGMALAKAVLLAHENGEAWRGLAAACRHTAGRYTREAQCRAIKRIFPLPS